MQSQAQVLWQENSAVCKGRQESKKGHRHMLPCLPVRSGKLRSARRSVGPLRMAWRILCRRSAFSVLQTIGVPNRDRLFACNRRPGRFLTNLRCLCHARAGHVLETVPRTPPNAGCRSWRASSFWLLWLLLPWPVATLRRRPWRLRCALRRATESMF